MADLFRTIADRVLTPVVRKARESGIMPSRKSSGATIGSTPRRSKRKAKRS